ncbi:MAG: hypothetical protein PF443_09240 [Allgaiera sp.]|jgi:hypothetical protein|nr:hypothetical protein [Allgaiera sp.]
MTAPKSCPPCNHDCNEGRDCPAQGNPSAAALYIVGSAVIVMLGLVVALVGRLW